MRRLLVTSMCLYLVGSLAGCFAGIQAASELSRPTYADAKVRFPPLPAGYSRMVIFKRLELASRLTGAALIGIQGMQPSNLIFDGRDADEFVLLNNHVVISDVPAGHHTLKEIERGAFGRKDDKGQISLDLVAGETAYILVTAASPPLVQVTEAEASGELAGLRFWDQTEVPMPGQVKLQPR